MSFTFNLKIMKQSKLFGKTVKQVPKDITLKSHELLYKGGFIRESVAGRYYFLPLGLKVQDRIMKIVEEEMDNAGAQKLITPVLHPLELWKETNRTNSAGFELMKVEDRRGAQFALGGTAEEMMVDLVRKYNISYKDLPFNIYQFSQKFRDEKRARGGLLRVREFMMKDAYSFHRDEEDFKKEYQNMWDTYKRIYERLGLEVIVVEADNGYIGGDYCHEFIVESEAGESRFLRTKDGKYAAHEDVAKFKKEKMNLGEEMKDLQEVDAPRGNTMEDGVKLHKLPLWQQVKDVVYKDRTGKFVLCIIRGDLDVNETKLQQVTGIFNLEMATGEEVREKLNSEPGFISPVGIKENLPKGVELIIVGDDSLRTVRNTYCGANKKNKDLLNMNIDRDYKCDVEGDIAMAQAGFQTLEGEELIEGRGIEVGNIFQLGYHYSKLMTGANFVDDDGREKPYYMGCYGIGIGRTLATIVEKHFDENGIVWPASIAPFDIHLIQIGDSSDVTNKALELYESFQKNGQTVLWDERDVRAGEKFADSDLIGIPNRIVISEKTLEKGGYELKKRDEKEASFMKFNN